MHSERPSRSIGRRKKAKTLIWPACAGGHSPRSIDGRLTDVPPHGVRKIDGGAMDINTLTFAFVIVALGIGGVIVYLKGR